jgi:dihydrofolate reductase
MGVSLDGFIAGPGGDISWGAPDAKLHRFHNEQMHEIGVHVMGRGLYETMLPWEDVSEGGAAGEIELEFARVWKPLPKVVFSTSLSSVVGNARLEREGLADEVLRLRDDPSGDGEVAVGGAGVAGQLMELDLIDEYRLFVSPVVLGAGTRFFAPVQRRLGLDLVESRVFGSRVVYARYRRPRGR